MLFLLSMLEILIGFRIYLLLFLQEIQSLCLATSLTVSNSSLNISSCCTYSRAHREARGRMLEEKEEQTLGENGASFSSMGLEPLMQPNKAGSDASKYLLINNVGSRK